MQLAGVLASNAWLHARGEHPLPVQHWMGVSWAQRKWLVLRALVGFAGIGFGFSAIQRIPLGDASALSFISPSVSVAVAWLTLGEAAGRAELLLARSPKPNPEPNPNQVSRAERSAAQGAEARRMAATLGGGIEVRPSEAAGGEPGLFATRHFKPNEWITMYDGDPNPGPNSSASPQP